MSASNPFYRNGERAPAELIDLLEKLPANFETAAALTADQLQMISAADLHATNYNHALINGIEAIGQLLFTAATSNNGAVDATVLGNTGCLLSTMAVQVQYLSELRGGIHYALGKHGAYE
jgi:hypothetical protein